MIYGFDEHIILEPHSSILKANLSWIWKKSTSSDAKKFFYVYIFHFCKPNFRYSSLSFVKLS